MTVSAVFPAEPPAAPISDDALLDLIQRQTFQYFLDERSPQNGLVRDRASNSFSQENARNYPASIAATGFALTAYGVGVSRGWIEDAAAREFTAKTLEFFLDRAEHEHGFFYHFLDMKTGKRAARSEISPIDTALFLAGAFFAAKYYKDARIREMTEKIYARVDWQWMLHGGKTLALAWSPEGGFHKLRWDHYNESMIMMLMAIAAPDFPIPAANWLEIEKPVGSYGKYRLIQMPPLFTHQYSHIWVDFRDQNDGFADYFKNSVNATLANRQFCVDQAGSFKSYGPNSWGLSASDGPFGYKAYGAPPGMATHDGTIAPTACGSSIVFTPKESMACLRHFYEMGDPLWGRYGFSDAFNLDRGWFDKEVIGIDQGAMLLMIENHRTELIWKTMARVPGLQKAMKAVGFKPGSIELPWQEPPGLRASYIAGGMTADGYLKDWPNVQQLTLDASFKENGSIQDDSDSKGRFGFAWDEKALYFYAKVTDDSLILRKTGTHIWLDDLVEIYIDPQGDGLRWYGEDDFQIGFRPHPEDGGVEIWSWFQGGEDVAAPGKVSARSFVDKAGYLIEGAISWRFLGIQPMPGFVLRLSAAIHDIDHDRSNAKSQWFFRNEREFQRYELGKVILGPEK
ncbi:MAG TPA: glucoamylase family protein [bacterium]|nr:glucoamylase family protein [bacterium]